MFFWYGTYFTLPSWNIKYLSRGVFLKIYSKFTGENPCQSEITLRHGCSHLNSLYIFRAPFPKNTTRGLLLFYVIWGTMVFRFHFPTLDFFSLWTSKSPYYYAISLKTLLTSNTCKCTIFQMRLDWDSINIYYVKLL